jgi:isoquinoline 1-oxidoreductase beta subunit
MMTTRRKFLIGTATATGALIVGYGLWPSRRLARSNALDAKPGERFVASWIKIADDGTITVVVPHCDIGTGTYTALAQMAADELDADWSKVRAETAPADPLFANGPLAEGFVLDMRHMSADSIPSFLQGAARNTFRSIAEYMDVQVTGGSSAVSMTGVYGMRVAGAAVREMLVQAAAAKMNAPVEAFHTELSRVVHRSGKSFAYGELAADAAEYRPSSHPKLKPRGDYKFVGKPVQRLDIPAKVTGTTKYGIDTKVPGMLYGAIRISPVFGGKLVSVEEEAVAHERGVKKVIKLDDAVVVLADRFWRARNASDKLEPVFDYAGNGDVSSKSIRDLHVSTLQNGKIKEDLKVGSGADSLQNAAVFERIYNVPYLAHAPMEPVNATAIYHKDGTLEVWAGTQDGLGSRNFCAKAAGLKMDKVTFHLLPSGGGYGRRLPGLWNFLTYSVKTAMAVRGVPVKLIFTREQEMQHDYYRPNVTSRLKATCGADGLPSAWVNDYTTNDDANSEAHIFYNVPNQLYGTVKVDTHIPTGPWRSVEASWHGFFVESFVDELAHQAKQDPLEYRRALLQDKPRYLGTLNLAAEKAGWGTPLPPNRGRGIAIAKCFGTIVAHVAEVEVADDGALKVHRYTTAADCGMAVNPNGFKAQMEGAVVFGLSAARFGEITIDRGAVVQENFPDYPVLHLAECPQIDVYIRESDAPLGGAGEPGIPPVAPALTNAIFAATGVRIRELPVKKHSLAKSARA